MDSLLQHHIQKKQYANAAVVGNSYANWLYRKKRIVDAISALQLSITYHQGTEKTLQSRYFKLAQFHTKLDAVKQSEKAFEKVIEIDVDNFKTARAYSNLASLYYAYGDFKKSQQYFEIAESKFKEQGNLKYIIRNHINSYNTYSRINTEAAWKKTIHNLLEADSLIPESNVAINTKLKVKRALLSYYTDFNTRDIELGERYGNEALTIAFSLQDSIQIGNIYNSLGNLYDQSDNKTAIEYNKKAFAYNAKSTNDRSITYANLGFNNLLLKNYKEGLSNFQNSLRSMTNFDFDSTHPDSIQPVLNSYFSNDNLWIILNNLAEGHLLYYEAQGDVNTLKKSLHYFNIADKIIDLYQQNTDETQSKLVWRRKATELYGRALKAAFLAKDIEMAHFFMEKNKALLLYEENVKRQQSQNLKLDDALLARKLNLQKNILELERISIKSNKNKIALAAQKASLKKLWDSIHILYPTYSDLKKVYVPKSIQEIQNSLDSSTVVINYHINIDTGYGIYPNQNKGYILAIGKDKLHFSEIDDTFTLKEQINDLALKNTQPFFTEGEIKAYKELSFNIYKKLFPPEIQEVAKNNKLIIVPDNYLSEIPFESLITSVDDQKNPYVLYQNQISYNYSYTFHEENKAAFTSKSQFFSSFAPVSFKNQDLVPLKNSISEIKSINTYFNGTTHLGEEATKKAFSQALEKFNIVHLATHANANDSQAPWIAFNDENIYLDEISLSQNNASLVVLSACNTTLGEIATGEGIMSLARGFFYGGTQTTISSLWKVNDRATADIMENLYKNLQEGHSKADALHLAKINYLDTHSGLELSPYYWSSFILIGDTGALPPPHTDWSLYIILGIFILLLSIGRYIWKKRNVA